MQEQRITGDMKVSEVVKRYPETVEVFLKRGCPDMRKGMIKFMAKIMSVKGAAHMHRIPLEELMRDLNAAIKPQTGDRHADPAHSQRSPLWH